MCLIWGVGEVANQFSPWGEGNVAHWTMWLYYYYGEGKSVDAVSGGERG